MTYLSLYRLATSEARDTRERFGAEWDAGDAHAERLAMPVRPPIGGAGRPS